MPANSTTGPITGLQKPVGGDIGRDAIKTTIAGAIDLINGWFHINTGHNHDGVNSRLINIPPSVPTMISKGFADSPYTVLTWNTHVDVDASGGAVIINLPTAVGNAGALIELRKVDNSANTVTVVPNGTQTVNGAASLVIYNQYDSYSLRSDGTNVEVV